MAGPEWPHFCSAIRQNMYAKTYAKNSAISVFELMAIPKYYFFDDYKSGKNTTEIYS